MATIRCDIVSAEAEIFHGEAELVVATGELGELGIAPKHAPLITRLKPGKVVVTLPGGEKLDFAISGGILGLISRPRRFRTVIVEGLEINIPPGGASLKGAGGTAGFPPLSAAATRLEQELQEGNVGLLRAGLAELDGLAARIDSALAP